MEDSKNLFSLFEHNGFTDRALESRVIVADVLAKFERYVIYFGHCSALKGLRATILQLFTYVVVILAHQLFFPVFRLAGSEEEEEEGEWKLYFKLYCFLDVESMPKEGVEFAFLFEQVRFQTLQQ